MAGWWRGVRELERESPEEAEGEEIEEVKASI